MDVDLDMTGIFARRGSAKKSEVTVWSAAEHSPGARQIGGSIDTKRNRVNDGYIDSHACGECPQLLQLLLLFQMRRRQRDEAGQCRSAIGIKTDMVEQRRLAGGGCRTGEVQRPPRGSTGSPLDHRLDDIRVAALGGILDLDRQRADIDAL